MLIKPQFEAGPQNVGKHGIVRDRQVHHDVVTRIVEFAADNGYSVLGLDFSPITGGSGNIEFLVHLRNEADANNAHIDPNVDVDRVIDAAYAELRS